MVPDSTLGLSILNRHPSLIEGPGLLHELVRKSSNTTEYAVDFLEDGSKRRSFSYQALHTLSDGLARRICHVFAGLRHASAVVPVLLPQSPELYITLLAILKAGKAFCPLSLDTPEERLKFILKDVSAGLLITTSDLKEGIPAELSVHLLLVDHELAEHEGHPHAEERRIESGNLAYVLYTSGSTGLPKAVSVSHRAVTQSLLAHDRYIPDFSRFLQFAAPTFDVSIFEIFFPLFRGQTLVGCSRTHMLNNLPETINTMGVDATELTPTVVSNLLRGRESVPGLKLLLTIGEMLTQYIVDEFGGNSSKKSILWGMYGPTEAAIHCTLQPSFQCHSPVGNIGIPLDTVSAFVAAPASNNTPPTNITLLPINEVGELVVGGPQVAEEYLNRPELTAGAFIQHPDFGYLYRTGDKVRVLPNGTLECYGRIVSGQVKLRGQRVELGEVEQVIAKVRGCYSVVATIIEDNLVAFCVTDSRDISKETIMDMCKRWMPSYMVPRDVVFVPQMPQLGSGKIDKKGLEAQYLRERQASKTFTPYLSDAPGRSILGILQDTLGRDIDLNTALASAGLDSLLSIRIASLLREKGYTLGAIDVLSAATFEELLSLCKTSQEISTIELSPGRFDSLKELAFKNPDLASRRSQAVDIIPCTPLQEAILAETVARPDAYCNWVETELSSAFTFAELQDFLVSLANQNEILRSGFCVTSSSTNSFAQIIWEKLDISQIIEVTQFSKKYSLGSMESFLRPLTIQVNATLEKPRVLFQIPHALYDGWSFDLILRDLSDIVSRRAPPLRPQYRDVVIYYSQIREGADHTSALKYWSDLLNDFHPTPLPNFNGKIIPDGPLRSISGYSEVTLKALYDRAKEWTLNPQVFFQAALTYLMSSYLGTTDVVIGTVTSGRTIPVTGIEEIMGPCIATLPLRLYLSGCSTVRSILENIQQSNRAMLNYSTMPLRDILKTCGLRPGLHLFDVLFVWQESLLSKDIDTLAVKTVDSADDLGFKATLEFEPRKDGIFYRTTYDSSVIPEAQVRHLAHQIDELVNFFIREGTAKIGQVGQCFSRRTLSIANVFPSCEYFDHGPAFAVERWAQEFPEKEALIFGSMLDGVITESETLSYAALNARANKLAHALLELKIPADQLVCVLLGKSVNLYISMLAVLKTGSGYLPITPETPSERISRILAEARVQVCISESSFSEHLRRDGAHIVLDVDKMYLSKYSDQNPDNRYKGSHLAYAVFTSGSTGTPKGVLVTQDNLMSNLQVLHELYPTPKGSRLLQTCSQAFDVSVFEIFFSWYAGICLCSATKDDLFYNFEDAINRLGITHLSLTPTVASLVNPKNVPKVKFLVTAGEPLNEHVRRQWTNNGLYQGYGPSETTNICTIRPSVTMEDLINNIGQPLKNTSAFVVEPGSDGIVPRGGIGELCFGGTQVFRGYLNLPELNAKKIIDHPEFGRIYRSGDHGLLLPDDSMLFTGRSDDQVKIRGQRVELGEINSYILDCAEVEDCVTVLFNQQDAAGQRLVTFWIPSGAATNQFTIISDNYFSSISVIFDTLALKLPTYMIPTNLIPITRIPVTQQAKVDTNLLYSTFHGLSKGYLESVGNTAPDSDGSGELTEQEKKIAEALAHTIKISLSEIQRNSSFFSLGLDSISAISFSSLLRETGIADLPVSIILKNSTISRLSSQIGSSPGLKLSSSKPSLEPDKVLSPELISQIRSDFQNRGKKVQKILPCTPLQEAMLSSVPSATEPSYFNTMVFALTGDLGRLQESWATIFQRHEILRTAFVPTDDLKYAFAQVITSYEELKWDELKPDQDINQYVSDTLPILMQIYQPPVRLATITTNFSMKLIFCCHHALYDGTAITQLLHEVEEAYNGKDLPSPVSYDIYLQHMVSQNLSEADIFWEQSLAEFEPTFFPSLSDRITKEGTGASFFTRDLSVPLNEVLEGCQASSVSLLSMLQSAWAKLMHFYLGEDDLCFGNVVSGRTLPEQDLERLVAPCFNTIPVRVKFDFGDSNMNLVRQLHSFNVDSLPFQLTPLRRTQGKVRKEGGRIFDTLFILQQPSEPLDNSIWTLESETGGIDLPIVCEISQDATRGILNLILHYDTSLLSDYDARIVVDTFNYAFTTCIYFPQSAARDTVGFPSSLLANSNLDFEHFKPADGSLLHSAFERNATTCPDSTALDFQHADGQRTVLTFEKLNQQANQIANALLDRDIHPEDIIPICMEKSPQFYASVLGVLKAGAAFVPFHLDLPDARKAVMLSEIRPKVLLCVDDMPRNWCGDMPILKLGSVTSCAKGNPKIEGLAPTNLAYCLYTSGSTGLPKAVSMEHRSPIQTIESTRSLIPWTHKSRLLQYAAITFDMCYYDCFLAWSFGFALCAASQSSMLNNIVGVINDLEADLLDLTPSVAASIQKNDVPRVTWLYCIGEAMAPEIVQGWQGQCVNSYGPTEAAFCTTIFPVSTSTKATVIGKPFPTTSFAVFPKQGEQGRAVPVFGIGELYIGGAQLARGYHDKSKLTEERFVQRNGQKFYKTGDMVRMLSDGNFEFVGRADDQVKIRGMRVELGEISHVLWGSDVNITSVTTQVLKKDEGAKDQLVAFLASKETADDERRSELKRKAKQKAKKHLPSYMVPQFFIVVDKIPKSMAGKVDKNALAKLFRESEDAHLGTDEAEKVKQHEWTETENDIREIFARLSRTSSDYIYPNTTIYQLGLDSISAVQIAAALRRKRYSAIATDVLKYSSCAELAVYLNQSKGVVTPRLKLDSYDFELFEERFRKEIQVTCGISPESLEAIRPCTPLQKGMISQFISKEGSVYFNHLQLQLERGINIPKLRTAWHLAMTKHRMLRTGFTHIKDKIYSFAMIQYTASSSELPWEEAQTPGSSQTIDEWLHRSTVQVLRHLHRPPWRIRVVEKHGQAYIDLAIFHALFDAQSLQGIFNDVTSAFNNLSTSPPVPLEPVLATILNLSEAKDTERRSFWQQLGKSMALTRFPNMAPLRYDPEPATVLARSSKKPLADLEAGCRKSNITLQAAGIAGWASILSAYTGEPSIACGIVLSGRNFEYAQSAIFPCITTVPFVCEVDGDKRNMLDRIMKLSVEIQKHQFVPLNEIQDLMGYPNVPVFDSLFAFQKTLNQKDGPGLWKVVDERATVDYPISVELEPKDGQLELRLTFLPHLVPQEQASLILDQLDHSINSFIFEPTSSMSEITYNPMLYSITPAKELTLPSKASLLHELFEFNAHKHPERIALEFATAILNNNYTSKTWTYAQLDTEGNQIAHLLQSKGIRPGSLVGVCFDKCPEASFAMLGILKAGCAFVALDPAAPYARRVFITTDSGAAVVVSMKAQSSDLNGRVEVPILNLDEVELESLSSAPPVLERPTSPQDRSYCLYTSGTTGTPKGCELTHENAVQALLSFQRLFASHWDEESRWLQFASFHFDVSVLEQYWSWSVGIRVVSAPRDLIFEDLATSIRVLGITHIDLTPSLARILHPEDVPTLWKGVFITGGESLKQEILDVWGPKGVIYNGYGPTEATIGVTMYPRVPVNGRPSNIGPQFDNVGSLVLRPNSDIPVLRGAVGELCVSGKLVGKGYLNRPELTQERFPYLERYKARIYRTGDLVRILHDYSFDFLGRADDQVKLRGQRLEIGEINSTIKQSSSDICDVATLVLKHPKQRKEQLVSFVVATSRANGEPRIQLDGSAELSTAREECEARLPKYMVPTHFVALKAMPLSANNKADARKLKEMYNALSVADLQLLSGLKSVREDAWSKEEERIRDVLKEVVGSDEEIRKSSSFFELGLDSITVISFARALKMVGFSKAAASLVMKNTSISRLAKALSERSTFSSDQGSIIAAQQFITAIQHRHRRVVAESLGVDPRDIEAIALCTPLQQGMIARFLESEQGLYFNAFYFKLARDIDEDKLYASWEEMFAATQILRTCFSNTEDGFVQAALRRPKLPWQHFNIFKDEELITDLDELKRSWWQQNRNILKRPFEIIFATSLTEKVLSVHIFHALYDGNSIALIFKTVWDIYNGRWNKDVGLSFQSALAYGPLRVVEGAQEFWKGQVSGTSFRPFPSLTDKPEGSATTVIREFDKLDEYDATRRKLTVTPQAIDQAVWATVLHKHTKGAITLGLIVSGRSIDFEYADRVIGPLFNTIPYQHRLKRKESWSSIIKKCHEFNVAAYPYQHTPLRDIMKWCKREPNQPLFDTLFVYQVAEGPEEWAKNDVWEMIDGGAEADYPLAIEIEQKGAKTLKLTLVTQGHISNEETSNKLLAEFETALREVLKNPDGVVSNSFDDAKEVADVTDEARAGKPIQTSLDGAGDFVWTDHANAIREEIANLAATEIGDINESTSIFELGLDSIDAIKLSSKLKKRGIDLAVNGIMRGLNIANMFQKIASNDVGRVQQHSDMIFKSHKRRLGSYLHRKGVSTDGIEHILPLTPLQEAMVAEMIASEYTRYFNHDVLKIAPETDIEKLQSACTTVVENSPILRTSFIEVDDPNIDFSFAQIVHTSPHVFWQCIKIEGEPQFNELFESIREDATKTSQSLPLFYIHHVECPSQSYLILSIAHALYDGWSLGLLHDDVHHAYLDHFSPRPSYESALQEILTTSGSDAAAFWRDYLSDAKTTSFPRRASNQDQQAQIVYRREQASKISIDDIIAFTRKNNITLQTLGQTIYALTLASYTRSLELVFGSVLSGRDNDKMHQALFPTMNTVAIRTILHGTKREMLKYVQGNFTGVKQWQHFPLRRAQAMAGVKGALFDTLFIYQKRLDEGNGQGKKLYESVEGQSDVEYPICVEMEVVSEELIWRCACKDEVFDERQTAELLDRLDAVLKDVLSQTDAQAIAFTGSGASICGLLAFKDKRIDDDEASSKPRPDPPSDEVSSSRTVKIIREVLAFVSKTPEEEITEGMTIFHIGLDSISAIKVSSLLRKQGIVLSVGEMLKAGTVENMAKIVDEQSLTSERAEIDAEVILEMALKDIDQNSIFSQAGILPGDVEQVLPASAGQIYIVSIWLNSRGTVFYPEFSYRIKGDTRFASLRKAWESLVSTNSILRTTFMPTNEGKLPYIQAVLRQTSNSIFDTTNLDKEEEIQLVQENSANQPYVHLFASQSSTGWDLKFKIHHALYDGVSLPLLMQQLQDLCNGASVSENSDIFPKFLAINYTDSAREQRKQLWTTYLGGIHQIRLQQPSSPPRSRIEVFKPGLISNIRSLDGVSRKNGVSIQSLFLAAYAITYASLLLPETSDQGTRDVVVGIYLANRSHLPSLSDVPIPTVSFTPLRVTSPTLTPLLELAGQIQYDMQEISTPENSGVALWEVSEWTGVKVDCFVNFLKLPERVGDKGGAEAEGIMIEECGQWEGEINRIKKVDGGVGEGIEGLRSGVNGSYLDAIDIEATTRNGGLDVGIFGPEEMMGLQEAEKLVEGIKVELSKLQIKGVGSGGSGLEQ